MRFLFALFLLASCASSQNKYREIKLKDLLQVTYSSGGSYSPDYSQIAYASNKSGTFNIWAYDLKTNKHIHLIESKERARNPLWSKIDGNIYFISDLGGNENWNIYQHDLKTKKTSRISGNEKTNASIYGFSQDGSELYYLDNSRDARYFDFYSFNLSLKKIKRIFKQTDSKSLELYIEKTQQIILSETLGDEKDQVYLYDLKNKKISKILGEGKYAYNVFDYSLDGNELYYTSNAESDFHEAYVLDLKTQKSTKILSEKWDIVRLGSTFNAKYHYAVINENGNYRIKFFSDAFKTEIKIPKVASGQIMITSIDRDEEHAVLSVSNDVNPGNLYSWNIRTNKIEQFVENLPLNIEKADLIESKFVTYKARDGLTISGYLYLPKSPKPKNGYPVVMDIHGGPKAQTIPFFKYATQFLLNQGFAVFAPNVRGSTGYGTSFHLMDNKDFGGKPLLDVVDGKKYLQSLPQIDPQNISIMGGSYGGYMVLAALAFTPDEFTAGVDIVGPSNLKTLLESFPTYWTSGLKYIHAEFGNPKTDQRYLKERSPLFKANQIKAPLIIFHGKNDARVKLREAQQIYAAIKKNKGVVELHVYDNEGHGFSNKNNIEDYLTKTVEFLKKNLK